MEMEMEMERPERRGVKGIDKQASKKARGKSIGALDGQSDP